jgi:hypothetical protein
MGWVNAASHLPLLGGGAKEDRVYGRKCLRGAYAVDWGGDGAYHLSDFLPDNGVAERVAAHPRCPRAQFYIVLSLTGIVSKNNQPLLP